jgi:hypothetical protein
MPCYKNYGGRGITVCSRWQGQDGFTNFLTDMGPRPSLEYTLDRFPDNNGNYEPGNCRWATRKQQARNSRKNHLETIGGATKVMSEWMETAAVCSSGVKARLKRGDTFESAVTTPSEKQKIILTCHGESLPLTAWATKTGLPVSTIYQRWRAKWPVEKILNTNHAGPYSRKKRIKAQDPL